MPQRSILETDLFVDKAKEREAMMLAKLQTTYTQEKSVIKKLNELTA